MIEWPWSEILDKFDTKQANFYWNDIITNPNCNYQRLPLNVMLGRCVLDTALSFGAVITNKWLQTICNNMLKPAVPLIVDGRLDTRSHNYISMVSSIDLITALVLYRVQGICAVTTEDTSQLPALLDRTNHSLEFLGQLAPGVG
jgi:hypothetical protein